jgi:hypothetical protein
MWTKWHWDRFFSEYFPCQFHSTGAPLLGKMEKKKLIIFLFFIFITRVAQ